MNEPERKLKSHITQSVIAVFTLMAMEILSGLTGR